MNDFGTMPINTMYRQVNHLTDYGIEGYDFEKKYEDPEGSSKARFRSKSLKHLTKRGHYLEDEARNKKGIPGPGKYHIEEPMGKKFKKFSHTSQKRTYIDEILNKKTQQKSPSPAHYNIARQLGTKLQAKGIVRHSDRITYLDNAEYEGILTPGVGQYNVKTKMKTQIRGVGMQPKDWIKKHKKQSQKSLPKLPNMATYTPQPLDYKLFSSNLQNIYNKNLLGKLQRFKTEDTGSGKLGPGHYNIITEWPGKGQKKGDSLLKPYKGPPPRVYN